MEDLRAAAREALQYPESVSEFHPALKTSPPEGLHPLWNEIAAHNTADHSKTCEDLLVAQAYLRAWGARSLSDEDENAANHLYDWASSIALPSPVFAEINDLDDLSDGREALIRDSRLKSILAVSLLASLAPILPIRKASNAQDIIIALASFTSAKDLWTSQESHAKSTEVLETFATETCPDQNTFWSVVEQILKERIKPLFAKTKNPAITAGGRKNFHPIPLPRFDASTLDPATKPWKNHDVYTTTVFSWIISQYSPANREQLETHFPLLVPPLLALIDDEGLQFKARGCSLLSDLLKPIRESKSDILQRTNLSSVFEDAVKPCLLSLPSITPEDNSIHLLRTAYPTLLCLLQTTHQQPSEPTTQTPTYTKSITSLLRDHLIPSYHHISTMNPTSASSLTSTFASFPHARLSTLLLTQIRTLIHELGLHTTKYLQDLIPLLYSTLSNPFGPAYPPLLEAAVSATRDVVLNAHPRVWRWRAEILGGICLCWVHVLEEEEEKREKEGFGRLKKEMQGVVYLVKVAVENPGFEIEEEPGVVEAKEKFDGEVKALVDAEEKLRELLLVEIDSNDGDYFGMGS